MNILKHLMMVLAVMLYFSISMYSRLFLLPLFVLSVASSLVGLYSSLKDKESQQSYFWSAFMAGSWCASILSLTILLAIVFFNLETINSDGIVEIFLMIIGRQAMLGPSVINSYRAYNDWRTASKNRDVRKSKEVVLDGETWEIPEILIEEGTVIEAQN